MYPANSKGGRGRRMKTGGILFRFDVRALRTQVQEVVPLAGVMPTPHARSGR